MAEGVKSFYDQLASNYHLIFEDWEASIRRQATVLGAILERECGPAPTVKVLDCACGIGTQALGLAKMGFQVTACDLSPFAVERTRMEADKKGLSVRAFVADMLDLAVLPDAEFDAVICMDNALPHLDSEEQLLRAASQMQRKLRPNGIFMASIRDYDNLVQEKPRVQGPNFYSDEKGRRIVHQLWDWLDDRRYTFHLYITRENQDGWESQHYSSTYRSIMRDELSHILGKSGFGRGRWILPDESGFYQPIVLAKATSTIP
ncbi:MAG TPA: class I SAM-dependent methyltransferase [Candidatus Binatia bacterium]|nr:class I SAM-dependent methyltransferase [Candidatus Binatia bacterium]